MTTNVIDKTTIYNTKLENPEQGAQWTQNNAIDTPSDRDGMNGCQRSYLSD